MECALRSNKKMDEVKTLCAKGTVLHNTVMMAGTPLGVAALKFDVEIFNILIQKFDLELDGTNDNDDNIMHSLIKYAYLNPEMLNNVVKMISYVINYEFLRDKSNNNLVLRKKTKQLLMMTNKDRLNPLQLAVKIQQFKIFELVMQTEVYRIKDSGDGVCIEERYDITEIETIPLQGEEIKTENHETDVRFEHHESILEYLVHHETRNAFRFVDNLPVREVIREKWKAYKFLFMGWFVVHLMLMVVLSVAAIYRSQLDAQIFRNRTAKFSHVVTHDTFVSVVSVVGLVFALLYLTIEVSRLSISRFSYRISPNFLKRVFRNFSSPYSNQIFRIYFALFSILLLLDCVLAATEASGSFSGYENYCLIFAVIIGWYLVMFFLKTIKAFSIFTVLIQRAIVDMLKFALVMAFFLIAFSVAMFMIMQGAETDEEDFHYFSTTMFKMLTIMIGIGDLEILFQARHPSLAILVFVLFVLLTTILLLNALIAMMSNSCTDLMSNYGGEVASKLHCRLQKLSIILFIESFLPRYFCKEVGEESKMRRYENNKWESEKTRRIWVRNAIHNNQNVTEYDKATHILGNSSENNETFLQTLHPKTKCKKKRRHNKNSVMHNESLKCSTLDITNYECKIFTTEEKETNFPEVF